MYSTTCYIIAPVLLFELFYKRRAGQDRSISKSDQEAARKQEPSGLNYFGNTCTYFIRYFHGKKVALLWIVYLRPTAKFVDELYPSG